MTKQTTSIGRRLLAVVIGLLLVVAPIMVTLAFGSKGLLRDVVWAQEPSRPLLLGRWLEYGLNILSATALIWAAGQLVRRSGQLAHALRFWLLAIMTGGVLVLLNISWVKFTLPGQIYDQLLPVLRGSQPLVTGVLISLLALPALRRVLGDKRWRLLGLVALSLPLVFNRDVFALGQGTSWLGVLVFMALGVVAADPQARPKLRHLLWVVPGAASIPLMIAMTSGTSLPIGTAARFVQPLSPLTVLPALVLAGYLLAVDYSDAPELTDAGSTKLTTWALWPALAVWIGTLMVRGGTWANLTPRYVQLVQDHFHLTARPMILAGSVAAYALVAVLVAGVVLLLGAHLAVWRNVGEHWAMPATEAWLTLTADWRQIGRRLGHDYGRIAITFVVLYLSQLLASLAMNQSWQTVENIYNPHMNIVAFSVFFLFRNMLLGVIVLLILHWMLLALTNRYWLSLILTVLLHTLFTVANVVKARLRDLPVVPSDMDELKSADQLMHMVDPKLLIGGGIVVVLAIVGIVWLERHSRSAGQPIWARAAKLVTAGLLLFGFSHLNGQYSYMRNVLDSTNIVLAVNNQLRFAQWNGVELQYLSNLNVKAMAKPAGYSKAAVANIVKKYDKQAQAANATRTTKPQDMTVIFNLSESFSDPTRIPGLKFNQDPMPRIRKLMAENTSGQLMSFGYGGGTADMEYMTLTGLSMGNFATALTTPYTQLVPSLKANPNVTQLFDYSSTLHPYTGTFYNRPQVYKHFGMDKFAYLGSKYQIKHQRHIGKNPYLADTTTYADALDQIKSRKGGQFLNLLSIQNHMPYNGWYDSPIKVTKIEGALATKKSQIATYAAGVYETDKAAAAFAQELDKLDKPVIWVFYGDHLPGIYPGVTDMILTHRADYFVYANKAAKAQGALGKQHGGVIGTDNILALAFAQGGLKLNSYTALLTAVSDNLPALWKKDADSATNSLTGLRFVDDWGVTSGYDKLKKSQQQVLRDYQMIQYDITVGKQYSVQLGMNQKVK